MLKVIMTVAILLIHTTRGLEIAVNECNFETPSEGALTSDKPDGIIMFTADMDYGFGMDDTHVKIGLPIGNIKTPNLQAEGVVGFEEYYPSKYSASEMILPYDGQVGAEMTILFKERDGDYTEPVTDFGTAKCKIITQYTIQNQDKGRRRRILV